MMKWFIRWTVMMTVAVSSMVYAVVDLMVEETFDYQDRGEMTCASVSSWVTDNGDATFTYFYQIGNVADDYKIHYFQFSFINPPVTVTNKGQTISGGSIYADWNRLEVGGDVYGMSAYFSTALTAGASSTILYYDSELEPGVTSGMLTGFDPTLQNISLTGNVYTPVPEPATMLLLAAGAAYVMRKRQIS